MCRLTNILMKSLFQMADKFITLCPLAVNAPVTINVPPECRPVIVFTEE